MSTLRVTASLLCVAGGIAFAAPAFATDIATPTKSNWSGFYIGPQGGWAWGSSDAEFANGASGALDLNAEGAFVGLVGGVNWQLQNNLLIGVEGDLSAAHLIQEGTGTAPPNLSHIDLTVDSLASIRARFGWLPNDDWLFYVTGGAAWAHATREQVHGSIGGGGPGGELGVQDVANWQSGWTVGLGVEHALGDNWTGRVEYDYASFGAVNYPLTFTPGGQGTNANLTLSSIKFALVKHFGSNQVGSLASTDVPFHWNGFYVGANAGYSWGHSSSAFSNGAPGALSLDTVGALAGGQLGFNWQTNNNLLLGVEGDWDAARISQVGTGTVSPNLSHIDLNVDQIASIRGRIGWVKNSGLLLYATAGAAWAHVNRTQVADEVGGGGFDPLTVVQDANWHTGWLVGLGAEKAIGHNWSANVEYTYSSFNTMHYPYTWTPGGAGTDAGLNLSIIKFGLNKHF